MTPWVDIIGYRCITCGGYATHWDGVMALCCDCHGGGLVSQDEARIMHEQGIDTGGLGGEPTDRLLCPDHDDAARGGLGDGGVEP
jgi:hypothetical protein